MEGHEKGDNFVDGNVGSGMILCDLVIFDSSSRFLVGGMEKLENKSRKGNKGMAWLMGMLVLDVLFVVHLLLLLLIYDRGFWILDFFLDWGY